MYHCHQEADIHVQMGMYGALVIYNPTDAAALGTGPGKGQGGTLFGWNYDKDYVMLLSRDRHPPARVRRDGLGRVPKGLTTRSTTSRSTG